MEHEPKRTIGRLPRNFQNRIVRYQPIYGSRLRRRVGVALRLLPINVGALRPNERNVVMQQSEEVAPDREPPNRDEWRPGRVLLKYHSLRHTARRKVLIVKAGELYLSRSSIAQFSFDRALSKGPEMMERDHPGDDERQQHRPADRDALADSRFRQ